MSLFTAGNTPTQGEEGASVRGDLPDSDPAEEEEEAAWWGRAFHIQLLAARSLLSTRAPIVGPLQQGPSLFGVSTELNTIGCWTRPEVPTHHACSGRPRRIGECHLGRRIPSPLRYN
ncbi:hypothetical protein Y1Q_0005617 [Alligator mississippiensis]|uniref:Uncharacterized protein n=1 Tax=Alligator mississippiensis TaxID=8496 RepID=A0A151MF94_ALLMI|nr:hypothetical protein Y1Q_0005617 [Alligator mississippiensis]